MSFVPAFLDVPVVRRLSLVGPSCLAPCPSRLAAAFGLPVLPGVTAPSHQEDPGTAGNGHGLRAKRTRQRRGPVTPCDKGWGSNGASGPGDQFLIVMVTLGLRPTLPAGS